MGAGHIPPCVVQVPDRVLEARPNVVLRRIEERIFVETHDVAFRRFGIRRSFDRCDLAEQTHPGQPDARGDLEDDEPGRGVGAAAGPLRSLLPRPEVQGNEARALPDHGGAGPHGEGAGRGGVVRARGGDGVPVAALHRGAAVRDPDPKVGAHPGRPDSPARRKDQLRGNHDKSSAIRRSRCTSIFMRSWKISTTSSVSGPSRRIRQ